MQFCIYNITISYISPYFLLNAKSQDANLHLACNSSSFITSCLPPCPLRGSDRKPGCPPTCPLMDPTSSGNEVHHHLHHRVLLLRAALGDEKRKGNKGGVGYALGVVGMVEDAVLVHEPEEERGCDALVAIAETVVLCHQVEKHGSLLLHRWVEVLTTKGLVDLPDGALERVVLLIGKRLLPPNFSRSSLSTCMAPS